MSLKEWKNNERTRLLMEKWGYRQKGAPEQEILAEGWGYRDEDDDDPTGRPSRRHDNPLKALSDEDYEEKDPADFTGTRAREEKATSALKKGKGLEENDEIEEGEAKWKAMADAPDDPTDVPTATGVEMTRTKKRGEWGQKVRGKSGIQGKRDKPGAAGSKNIMTMGEGGDEEEASLEEGDPLMKLTPKGHRDTETSSDRRLAYEKDPAGHMTTAQALELGLSPDTVRSAVDWHPDAEHPDDRRDPRQYSRGGHAVGLGTARRRWRKAFAGQFKEGKISVQEAKNITRRIIERIRKEGN